MNLVTRLFGFGASFTDPDAAELVKIQSGQLYLSRPGNIRSSRECIYNDAMATVRRAPSIEHNFQLVITRVFEEGEEDILEEEDENDDKVFLIGEELEFRTDFVDGEPSLVWRDLDGDVDESYEFVATGTNKATIDFFVQCMYKAMFEQFVWRGPEKTTRTAMSRSPSQDPSSLATPTLAPVVPAAASPPPSPPAVRQTVPSLISRPAELYLWNMELGFFDKEGDVDAKIIEKPGGKFDYILSATTPAGGQVLAHPLVSDLNVRWSTRVWSLTWNHSSPKGVMSSWCFKFAEMEDFEQFQECFGKCLYQHLNAVSWEKTKAEDKAYVLSSYSEDVDMRDVEDEEDDEDQIDSALNAEGEQSEDESETEETTPAPAGTDRNSQLLVGYKNDRTFVTRGDKIGVFKHTNEGKVEYAATIKNLGFKSMKSFKPKNMMLHDQDSKLILMNPAERHSLFSMDIEYGKVVEEWKVHDSIQVDHIAPKDKFAQMTGEQTLVGASHNALFRIDPRAGSRDGNAMVEHKQYTSKNQFSGVTTTATGKLAVASEKGDIRLFDTVGKQAKTALPAMGDPIIGIDVTANGRWIVATCKPYLLLIDTLIGEGRWAGSLGFDKSFPADAKPQPKRLQLRGEHAAYMGHEVSFSPARFNVVEGEEENAIVTSTGRYVIAWDFAKVKKGKLDSYVIKKYEDDVVQDNFRFGDDKEIIVALTNDVLALNKKNLKKLPHGSLGTPTNLLKSRSDVVNSPY